MDRVPPKRTLQWVLFAMLCAAIGYFGYDGYQRYLAFKKAIADDAAREAEVLQNRERLTDALLSKGVGSQEVSRGFWYTYADGGGGESVEYFDVNAWAQRGGLSQGDIELLAAQAAAARRSDRDTMRAVPSDELPAELRFHNDVYGTRTPGAFQDTQGALERAYESGSASAEALWQLSYLYELKGEYGKRDAVNAESCRKFKQRCADEVSIRIEGRVVDITGRPVQGASVSVLSRPDAKGAATDAKGAFSLALSVKPMEKVRVSAVKRNFSEGVASVVVLQKGRAAYGVGDIVLGSPITVITIDTKERTVTDPGSEARADGSFVLRAEASTYEIPQGAIVRGDGTPYRGVVDVYIYEFTRDTVPQNLITLDTFDEVMGYAGDLMKSYGMPFIQFFAANGEQLDVRKTKPMLLTYAVPGMQDMKENIDALPSGPVTDADIETLVAASKGDPGFPVTGEFLLRNGLQSYPPFWVLDRKTGVWENTGIRVLDVEGTIQAPFYTLNDTL